MPEDTGFSGWGQVISGIGGLAGGYLDSRNQDQANEALAAAYGQIVQDAPIQAQYAQYAADPFAAYRPGAAEQLAGVLSGDIDFTTDPGYQFQLNQAIESTEASAAARGYNRSGNVLEAVRGTAQGVASQEYSNIIDRLTGLAGATPQNALGGGQVYGGLIGESYSAMLGQAQASGAVGAGQGGLVSGAGGLLGGIFGGFSSGGLSF